MSVSSCNSATIYGQEIENGISITCRGLYSCASIDLEYPYSCNGLYKDDPINNNAFCYIDCDSPSFQNGDAAGTWFNNPNV